MARRSRSGLPQDLGAAHQAHAAASSAATTRTRESSVPTLPANTTSGMRCGVSAAGSHSEMIPGSSVPRAQARVIPSAAVAMSLEVIPPFATTQRGRARLIAAATTSTTDAEIPRAIAEAFVGGVAQPRRAARCEHRRPVRERTRHVVDRLLCLAERNERGTALFEESVELTCGRGDVRADDDETVAVAAARFEDAADGVAVERRPSAPGRAARARTRVPT